MAQTEERINPRDCTHAFAVPGESNMIDLVHPVTGRSCIYAETLEQIRERYPTAELVNVDEWLAAKAARQDSPITWSEITEDRYHEMLNVLPPAYWENGLFLMGEPQDHHATTGQPRFDAFKIVGGRYFASSRPMTIAEAKREAL